MAETNCDHRRSRATQRATIVLAVAVSLSGCVSGTGLGLNVVSEDQVQTMGLESWRSIRAQTPASDNAALQRRARQVADRLLRGAGEAPAAWETVVFKGDEVNAFALPGRKIGIYEGMFGVAGSDDELAAVIGHEVAHVHAHHATERTNTELGTQLGTQLIVAALGSAKVAAPETVAQIVGSGARYGIVMPYSRNQELQADEMALDYMVAAGFNPRAAVELWRKMAAVGGRRLEFLSTHPDPERRMEALEQKVATFGK